MAIGKKLMLLGCFACIASALLLVCIAAPAIVSLVNSGKPLCMPGLSIRCHESDCGRFYQRCGSIALLEVPANKVCERGALLSAKRMDLHSCAPTTVGASNSSRLQSGIGACDCSTSCPGVPSTCRCLCNSGSGGSVQCTNPLKTYPSDAVARCCLQSKYSSAHCSAARKPRMWEIASETLRLQFTELLLGQWSLQDPAATFTFPPPLSDSNACVCNPGGTCGSVC